MVGAEVAGDVASVAGLVEGRLGEADRKTLHVAAQLGHHRGDRARIDAPRQEHADGHIADQLLAYCLTKCVAQPPTFLIEIARTARPLQVELGSPIAAHRRTPTGEPRALAA